MNKEQFKISISNLINYYLNTMVSHNMGMKDAVAANDDALVSIINKQMDGFNEDFMEVLDDVLDKVFVGVVNED